MNRDEQEAKPSKREAAEKQEAGSSSIEEEAITAANDSLCSDNIHSADEKGTTGITGSSQQTNHNRATIGVFDIFELMLGSDPC